MIDDREQEIRERAYAIWERDGCPAGVAEDHWHEAAREVNGPQEASVAAEIARPAKAAGARSPAKKGAKAAGAAATSTESRRSAAAVRKRRPAGEGVER
jgi:hypothetical protein